MNRRRVFRIAIILLVALALTGCSIRPISSEPPATEVTPEVSDTSGSESESGSVQEPTAGTVDISATEMFLTEFGVSASPYIYWAPDASSCLFMGSNEGMPVVFFYRSADGQLLILLEGDSSFSYYLAEPAWSSDGSRVTVPFFPVDDSSHPVWVFYLETESIESLPFEGTTPAFSPDGSMLAYSNTEGLINVYRFAEQDVLTLDNQYPGYSPLWLSDNRQLLYIAPTGNNPSGLDYGELKEVRNVDITDPSAGSLTVLEESSYLSLSWLLDDQLVLVASGMDDGYYTSVLDLASGQATELGETHVDLVLDWNGAVSLAVPDFEGQSVSIHGQDLSVAAIYPRTVSSQAISLLSDGSLLLLTNVNDAMTSTLDVARPDTDSVQPVVSLPGQLIAIPSADGSCIALYDQDADKLYILDAVKFAIWQQT